MSATRRALASPCRNARTAYESSTTRSDILSCPLQASLLLQQVNQRGPTRVRTEGPIQIVHRLDRTWNHFALALKPHDFRPGLETVFLPEGLRYCHLPL